MEMKHYKPTMTVRRVMSMLIMDEITTDTHIKYLCEYKVKMM